MRRNRIPAGPRRVFIDTRPTFSPKVSNTVMEERPKKDAIRHDIVNLFYRLCGVRIESFYRA